MQELEEKILLHVQQFHLFGYHFLQEVKKKVFSILAWFGYKPREDYLEMPKWQQEFEEQFDARLEYNDLIEKGMLRVGEEGKYELTEKGREEAEKRTKETEEGAAFIGKHLLSPQATARNTIKDELVNSLERTFKPEYIPILSEFEFSLGERFDFEKEFDNPIKPLSDKGLLVKEDDKLILAKKGEKHVDKVFGSMKYHHHT